MDRDEVFSKFRPFCAALATRPSKEVLEKLSAKVSESDPKHLEDLQEYILFPCQLYLKTPVLPENFTIQVLKFVEEFFRDSVVLNSSFLMTDLLQSILRLTGDDVDAKDRLSEDLKVGICDCLARLIESSNREVKMVLFNEDQKLAVSHLVFQVLEWAQPADVRQVVLSSLNLIDVLCVDCDDADDVLWSEFVGQFCQMLPGITTKLVKVLQQPRQAGPSSAGEGGTVTARVVEKCLRVWRRFVVSVFCDVNIEQESKPENLAEFPSARNRLLSDPRWVGKAQDHLLSHLQIFERSFTTSPGLRIRKQVVQISSDLLKFCFKAALPNLLLLVAEMLSVLSVDQDPDVRRDSREGLRKLTEIYSEKPGSSSEPLVDQVQQKVFNLTEKFSLRTSFFDEFELIRDLSNLNGALYLLKQIEPSTTFFFSETYVAKLVDAILNLAAFNPESSVIVGHFAGTGFIGSPSASEFIFSPEIHLNFQRPERNFKHLTTPELKQRFAAILAVVATYSDLAMILDLLFADLKSSSGLRRTEVVYVISKVVEAKEPRGEHDDNPGVIAELVDSVVDAFLNLNVGVSSGGAANNNNNSCGLMSVMCDGFGILSAAAKRFEVGAAFCRDHLGLILAK